MPRILKQFWLDLLASKHYIIAALMVFLAGWLLGVNDSGLSSFLQGSSDSLKDIAGKIANSAHPQLYLFLFIFLNNAIKAILFIYLGAFLGLWPLSVLLINGMMLGYALTTHPSGSPVLLFMKGIMPHGILELPAIIVACAYGIRFGGVLIKSFFMLLSPQRRAGAKSEVIHFLKMTLPLVVILTIVLFIAAVIESTITWSLMT